MYRDRVIELLSMLSVSQLDEVDASVLNWIEEVNDFTEK